MLGFVYGYCVVDREEDEEEKDGKDLQGSPENCGYSGPDKDPQRVDHVPFREFIKQESGEDREDQHHNRCQICWSCQGKHDGSEDVSEGKKDREPDDRRDHFFQIIPDQDQQDCSKSKQDRNKDDRVCNR